jgi:ATP-dependent Lon protease
VAFPGGVIPLDISRATSARAISAALATEVAFLAIFAQRTLEVDRPTVDDLHTTGCLCVVLHFQHRGDGAKSFTVVEGVRWITLEALEQMDPYYLARVSDTGVERGDDQEIAALDRRLRDAARKVAAGLPEVREEALALIEATQDIAQLADLVMANFPRTVAESAAYATETQLARRLERVIAVLDGELAKAGAAPAP